MKRKIIGIAIILLWILSRSVKSYSAGDADLQELAAPSVVYNNAADWYSDGEVEFAINIFDDEWKELYTQEEMIAACQIPDKLLKKLTTYELLKLTEEYPLLGNIYTGNTMEEGFQYIVDSFNGLRELLKRADCLEIVCEEYNNLIIPEEKMINYNKYQTEEENVAYFNEILQDDDMLKLALEDAEPLIVCDLLEMIMLNKTTDDNVELLLETVIDKAPEKEKAECFESANKSLYISGLEDSILSDISAYVVTETTDSTTTKTIYWRGVAIEVLVDDNLIYNTFDEAMKTISVYREQGASLVSVGCRQSNCHSYAWLKEIFPGTSHKYTLNIVPDGLMKECIKYTTPQKNSIAYTAQHSAVVIDEIDEKYGTYNPIVIAKWAVGPVVKAPMDVGPMWMKHGEGVCYYCYRTLTK